MTNSTNRGLRRKMFLMILLMISTSVLFFARSDYLSSAALSSGDENEMVPSQPNLATGTSVSIDEAPGGEYAFVKTSDLHAEPPEAEASFGMAVAVDGNTVMVGAYNDEVNGWQGAGAVYV